MAMMDVEDEAALTEDCSWSIITGETGLTHSRTILDVRHIPFNASLHILAGHRYRLFWIELVVLKSYPTANSQLDDVEAYPLSMTRAATSSVC